MLWQITQICSYESDYIKKHSDMNIMTENCAEITSKTAATLKNNEQNLRQAMLSVGNIVYGERENFKLTF